MKLSKFLNAHFVFKSNGIQCESVFDLKPILTDPSETLKSHFCNFANISKQV